jgi:hypothetical protein
MMKARNFGLVLGVALVLFAGSFASAAFVAKINATSNHVFPSGGNILYSQLDDPSGYGFTDQEFEAVYAAYSGEGADDFNVTDAPGWDLTTINTPGFQTAGGIPFFTNHFFYADAGGTIGAVLDDCEFPASTAFVHDAGNFATDVSGCNAPTGVNWFSQSIRQDFVPFGQHFWLTRVANAGNPALFRNPGNGFGTGCIDWSPANAVCLAPGKDLQFELVGDIRPPNGTPAVGPFGIALMVLGLGAGSAYVMRRRNA